MNVSLLVKINFAVYLALSNISTQQPVPSSGWASLRCICQVQPAERESFSLNSACVFSEPPFHLTRRGWGEFPVRVQIHFKDQRNKRIDIIHHLKVRHLLTACIHSLFEPFCCPFHLSFSPTLSFFVLFYGKFTVDDIPFCFFEVYLEDSIYFLCVQIVHNRICLHESIVLCGVLKVKWSIL